MEKFKYSVNILICMANDFEMLVNEAALKIREVLAFSAIGKQFPTYDLHVVVEAITDREEELGMWEAPSDEKFRHTIEKVPGIILDIIKTKDPTGGYPGALGIIPTDQSHYPYVILNPDGSITRRVGSCFPDREGYFPCDAPVCVSENSFPIDYLVYAGRALDTIQKLPSVSDAEQKMFYVVFVDNHAGGYGYWLGESEQDLRTRLKGGGYDDVRYGSFPKNRADTVESLIRDAIGIATEPFHTNVNRVLDDMEATLQQAPPTQ